MPLMHTYQCQCVPGYTGNTCEESINKCQPNPCQHDGQCSQSSNSFSCACTTGWVGKTCQFEDPCINSQCENGATCKIIEQFGKFSCVCPENFTGEVCETSLEPTDQDSRMVASSTPVIGGAVAACVLGILVLILLVVGTKKGISRGTYSPSKEQAEAGLIELNAIAKPLPRKICCNSWRNTNGRHLSTE